MIRHRKLWGYLLIVLLDVGNISFMQVRSASAGRSSKSLHSNSQSKVSPQHSGIPANMRHDYVNIYLPLSFSFYMHTISIIVLYTIYTYHLSSNLCLLCPFPTIAFSLSCFLSFHPPPAFGSSANMELALGESQLQVPDTDNYLNFYAHYAR